jgi:hypothetical protein
VVELRRLAIPSTTRLSCGVRRGVPQSIMLEPLVAASGANVPRSLTQHIPRCHGSMQTRPTNAKASASRRQRRTDMLAIVGPDDSRIAVEAGNDHRESAASLIRIHQWLARTTTRRSRNVGTM